MAHPVFISYARKTSRRHADALHAALAEKGISAFLDSSDIENSERFPEAIAEALLAAHVVVALVDETYFTRWYCIRELQIALSPFVQCLQTRAHAEKDCNLELDGVVISLHPDGVPPHVL